MLKENNHNIILPKYFESVKQKGSSLALPANGLGGSRATSLLVAHFALQNTKFGSEKGKVQKPARIPPQTPPAGGKKAEAGQFHSPRKIVCPAESKLVFRIFVKKCSNINQKTPQQNNEPSIFILGSLFYCGDAGIRSRVTKFFAPSIRKKQSTRDPASPTSTRFARLVYRLRLSNPSSSYKINHPVFSYWVHYFVAEDEGFEPSKAVTPYTLSKRAH